MKSIVITTKQLEHRSQTSPAVDRAFWDVQTDQTPKPADEAKPDVLIQISTDHSTVEIRIIVQDSDIG